MRVGLLVENNLANRELRMLYIKFISPSYTYLHSSLSVQRSHSLPKADLRLAESASIDKHFCITKLEYKQRTFAKYSRSNTLCIQVIGIVSWKVNDKIGMSDPRSHAIHTVNVD